MSTLPPILSQLTEAGFANWAFDVWFPWDETHPKRNAAHKASAVNKSKLFFSTINPLIFAYHPGVKKRFGTEIQTSG
jgi:hypothetical protein